MPVLESDAITLEVMRNALASIADEMAAGLMRTAYSTNIKDRRDHSCAIYTAEGDVVAMSEFGGTPLHLGTMHSALGTALAQFPAASLEPGDILILNSPYPAGPGHLNDICLIAPVFGTAPNPNSGSESPTPLPLLGFVANQAHHVDVGGFAPGSMPFGVTEVYQEGLQIPPLKLARRGEVDEQLVTLIAQNEPRRFASADRRHVYWAASLERVGRQVWR
jgi:N-methylhydantoinase B